MPIYMDLHVVPGVKAKNIAEAHYEDVRIQEEYSCRCMTYWIDEDKDSVFCLIDAPNKDAVIKLHQRSHGLVPHEIIQVNSQIVEAFLGRIFDPDIVSDLADANLKIFNDRAFRTIMVIEAIDVRLLRHALGNEKAYELLSLYNNITRDQLKNYEGREAESDGEGFVISFVTVTQAVECALAIQDILSAVAEPLDLRIGLHAGMPVTQHDVLFGATIKMARYLCRIGKKNQVVLSSMVRDLFREDDRVQVVAPDRLRCLCQSEESFLEMQMDTLSKHWHNPRFTIDDFCRSMSMSKSQLYRKSKAITGSVPNMMLQEYRLRQSLDLLKKDDRNVTQTTFDSGFSSPSYFTKCFQKRFGLQPLTYLKSLAEDFN